MGTVLGYGFILLCCCVSDFLFALFCHWSVLLGSPNIEYSETEFITPSDPEASLLYIIAPSGAIVPFWSGQPSGCFRPGVVSVARYSQW